MLNVGARNGLSSSFLFLLPKLTFPLLALLESPSFILMHLLVAPTYSRGETRVSEKGQLVAFKGPRYRSGTIVHRPCKTFFCREAKRLFWS